MRKFFPKNYKGFAVIIVLFLSAFLLYWYRLLLKGMMPFDGNMLRFSYPTWAIGKNLLHQGFYLLWDPYRNMGQPFLADPQSQALYPIRLLSPFLNFLSYMRLYVVFHCLVACTFAYCLAENWYKDFVSALLAAFLMGFNGLFLARVTMLHHFASLAWGPAALYFLSTGQPILLGLCLTFQWLAGFPSFFILTLFSLFVFSVAQDDKRAKIACLAKGFLLAISLSAIQIIPFLEMIRLSVRGVLLSRTDAMEFSVPPFHMVKQIFLPSWLLTQLEPASRFDPAIISFYMGPMATILFFLGWLKGGFREKLLGGAAALGVILALGSHSSFYKFIPFVTVFRYPANWLLLVMFCSIPVMVRGFLVVKSQLLRKFLFGFVVFDLLIYALPLRTAWGDLQFFSETPELIRGLEILPSKQRLFHTMPILGRVHGWTIDSKESWQLMKGLLVPSYGCSLGLKEAASYHQLASVQHAAFIDRLNQVALDSPLFDYAGIEKIITLTPEGAAKTTPTWADCGALTNPNPKPRVFFQSENDPGLSSFGKETTVVKIDFDRPGYLSAEAIGPGRLVFSESFAPGWHVTIDGEQKPMSLFEENFLAVMVPQGKHTVLFFYRPISFVVGCFVTCLALLWVVLNYLRFSIFRWLSR